MKKVIIRQYGKEPAGSTIGAFLYRYGINFNGNYYYDCTMSEEGMSNLITSLKQGNDVEFIKDWETPITQKSKIN